jgi:hypothetical protein
VDVNLTGQVAASLIQNPWTIVGASAIGGLVAGGLTLLGVIIAHKYDADRDKQAHKEEERRIQREERKNAYIGFITFKLKADSFCRNPNMAASGIVEAYNHWDKCVAELALLSPEITNQIVNILAKYPYQTSEEFLKKWPNISNDLKDKVLPLMQGELKMR